MATGGWGGAWGAPKAPAHDPDLDGDDHPQPSAGPSPLYAYNTGPAAHAAPASTGGFMGAFKSSTAGRGESEGAQGGSAFGAGPSGYGGGDLAAREAALNKKAAELDAKEKQLNTMKKELESSGQLKRKNWPICLPMLYHNIPEEIPEKSRRVVREIYMCWWGLVVCLGWNLFCASVMLGTSGSQKVPSWFLAIVYALLGIPLSFWGWYQAIYKAGKNDSTASYLFFFIAFLIHTAFCIWAAIAVPFSANQWSFAGWITAMKAFDEGSFPGIIYIVGASLWTLEATYCLWCIKDSYLFFRGAGGIEQAKQDAALSVFKAGLSNNAQRV